MCLTYRRTLFVAGIVVEHAAKICACRHGAVDRGRARALVESVVQQQPALRALQSRVHARLNLCRRQRHGPDSELVDVAFSVGVA